MQIGRYDIIEELGRGGFGIVYKALDPALEVHRAIKILHPGLMVDPNLLARFNQEAKLPAQFDHPNLVPVYDMGEDNGHWFIVMKYMEGGALISWFNKYRSAPYQKILDVLQDICSGLSFAHENGIIHRDLKPGNILFDEYGRARISDLGFAKALNASSSVSLSATGAMIGTPAYMAPEIWQGKGATPATDIYSLGCIFYEMLSGQVLFQGESPADVMTMHIMNQPEIPLHWSEPVRSVLRKALEKDPENRNQTAEAFWEDLESKKHQNIESNQPVEISPPRDEPIIVKEVKSNTGNRYRNDEHLFNFTTILLLTIVIVQILFILSNNLFLSYAGETFLSLTAATIGFLEYKKIKNVDRLQKSEIPLIVLSGFALISFFWNLFIIIGNFTYW